MPQSTHKVLKKRKNFQKKLLRALLTIFFQALKWNLEDFDKSCSKATIFHRFFLYFFKLFSPQLKNQADSDSLYNNFLLDLVKQAYSVKASIDQNDTDLEQIKRRSYSYIYSSSIQKSSSTKIFPKERFNNHRFFRVTLKIFWINLKFYNIHWSWMLMMNIPPRKIIPCKLCPHWLSFILPYKASTSRSF